MADFVSLAHHFLIAMPSLVDPNFYRSVTYICKHDDDGAMGIVINNPLDFLLGEVLEQMGIEVADPQIQKRSMFLGGPVSTERGFVIHRPLGKWEFTMKVKGHIGVTTSSDIVSAVANGKGPKKCLFALGYAGWGAGQLEKEFADNVWLSGPADSKILFDKPVQDRWEAAAALLGFDINNLSNDIGHS